MSICYAQSVILNYFDKSNPNHCDLEQSQHKHEIVWIFYQIVIFYLNIASQIIFLFSSRFVSFRTIREKAGLGGQKRNKVDFLDFVKNDIHYFIILVSEVFLFGLANSLRTLKG